MSLIQKVAYLEMCDCGQHGKIVLANGVELPEFFSKQVALMELEKLFGDELITELEFKFLRNQVSNLSGLPENADLPDLIICGLTAGQMGHDSTEDNEPPPKYVM
ncbi:MAG: hypothetical protein V1896_00495 [Candidatus Zambryskibacteria bacterium]